jgi:F0F1-type ATP synthase delta subunit
MPARSQEEFDKLKREVEKMKELLKKAKEIDEATEQPNCEKENKVAMLKKLAELVGVDLKDVFAP